MASIYSLKRDLQRYNNLRSAVTQLQGPLSAAVTNVRDARVGMSNAYTINGVSADNGLLSEIEEKLSSKSSTLSNVINAIDYEIAELNRRISYEESKKRR